MVQNVSASDICRILKRLDQIEDSLKAIRGLLKGLGYSPGGTMVTGTNVQVNATQGMHLVLGGTKDTLALLKHRSQGRRQVKMKYHKGKNNVKR